MGARGEEVVVERRHQSPGPAPCRAEPAGCREGQEHAPRRAQDALEEHDQGRGPAEGLVDPGEERVAGHPRRALAQGVLVDAAVEEVHGVGLVFGRVPGDVPVVLPAPGEGVQEPHRQGRDEDRGGQEASSAGGGLRAAGHRGLTRHLRMLHIMHSPWRQEIFLPSS